MHTLVRLNDEGKSQEQLARMPVDVLSVADFLARIFENDASEQFLSDPLLLTDIATSLTNLDAHLELVTASVPAILSSRFADIAHYHVADNVECWTVLQSDSDLHTACLCRENALSVPTIRISRGRSGTSIHCPKVVDVKFLAVNKLLILISASGVALLDVELFGWSDTGHFDLQETQCARLSICGELESISVSVTRGLAAVFAADRAVAIDLSGEEDMPE